MKKVKKLAKLEKFYPVKNGDGRVIGHELYLNNQVKLVCHDHTPVTDAIFIVRRNNKINHFLTHNHTKKFYPNGFSKRVKKQHYDMV